MKRSYYIAFVLLAFVALFAVYPAAKLLQWHCREEMERRILSAELPDSLVQQFTDIDKNASVQWKDGGDECYVDGRLYDVISVQVSGGHKLFRCICDENEEQIIDVLNSIAARDSSAPIPGKKWTARLIRELFALFFLPAEKVDLYCFSQEDPVAFLHACPALAECRQETDIPPPELL